MVDRIEGAQTQYSEAQAAQFLKALVAAETFEGELHRKFVGAKRFSLQGGDALIPMFELLCERAAQAGIARVVTGMAHRGRLSILANCLGKPFEVIFSEFEDRSIHSVIGAGDVKYHMGYETERLYEGGKKLALTLAPNPSHLEAVNPVVEGIARAYQDLEFAGERKAVLPVLIHGDAAMIGQGVVWETFNLSLVAGYKTGGTVHIVINNQVGFTTDPTDARSTIYCTEPAKAFEAPVLHVNGEDVEACARAIELALEFRNQFAKDVVIDLICYRKYGHNEGDDPSFTQPVLYSEVREKRPLLEIYAVMRGAEFGADRASNMVSEFKAVFNAAQERQSKSMIGDACALFGKPRFAAKDTGVSLERLTQVAELLCSHPEDFKSNSKLMQILQKRVDSLRADSGIDWGLAEGLAFGSLVQDGVNVRLSGQDCGRGTFSHRHLMLIDIDTLGRKHSVLEPLASSKARFDVVNSVLSEFAVMGFEFGYSTIAKNSLVMWEAQFGDFANGAQTVIDQFLVCSEVKWGQLSGLTLLLPHGYEGQGPEHSSARLERYLQLSADSNITVCNPTQPSQYFHMLRRQAHSVVKRPLVVMTPKSLLRSPAAASKVAEFTSGQFSEILVDEFGPGAKPALNVLCSGKVFYDLAAALQKATQEKTLKARVVVARLEQIYPFPTEALQKALKGSSKVQTLWVQEEPQNMGAWNFVRSFLEELGIEATYVGRAPSASTATGSGKRHTKEQQQIVDAVLAAAR